MSTSEDPVVDLFCKETPWNHNTNNIWLGSSVSVSRNIEKFHFPGKLSGDKRQQVIGLLSRELLKSDNIKNPKLIPAKEVSAIQKEYLVEHFLSDRGFDQTEEGEAFLLDDTGEFLALINLQDHLLLHSLDLTQEIELAWQRLNRLEMDINRSLNFAFSEKFGFLTSDPLRCGTALVVHIFLHLPAMLYSGRLEESFDKIREEGIDYAGLQGSPTDLIGDVVSFRNLYTLGVNEENILSSLRTLATKLLVEETGLRLHFKQEGAKESDIIKDKISRAYAILLHSYRIEEIESLEAISMLKLGLDLEWVKGVTHADLNKLIFASRRAHSLSRETKKTSLEELPHRRSEYIHNALKGIELLV